MGEPRSAKRVLPKLKRFIEGSTISTGGVYVTVPESGDCPFDSPKTKPYLCSNSKITDVLYRGFLSEWPELVGAKSKGIPPPRWTGLTAQRATWWGMFNGYIPKSTE